MLIEFTVQYAKALLENVEMYCVNDSWVDSMEARTCNCYYQLADGNLHDGWRKNEF